MRLQVPSGRHHPSAFAVGLLREVPKKKKRPRDICSARSVPNEYESIIVIIDPTSRASECPCTAADIAGVPPSLEGVSTSALDGAIACRVGRIGVGRVPRRGVDRMHGWHATPVPEMGRKCRCLSDAWAGRDGGGALMMSAKPEPAAIITAVLPSYTAMNVPSQPCDIPCLSAARPRDWRGTEHSRRAPCFGS